MKWPARIGATLTAVTLWVLVPASAWAAEAGVLDVAYEVARRPRFRGVGLVGMLCCLVVVALVAVGVLFIVRGRNRRR